MRSLEQEIGINKRLKFQLPQKSRVPEKRNLEGRKETPSLHFSAFLNAFLSKMLFFHFLTDKIAIFLPNNEIKIKTH